MYHVHKMIEEIEAEIEEVIHSQLAESELTTKGQYDLHLLLENRKHLMEMCAEKEKTKKTALV